MQDCVEAPRCTRLVGSTAPLVVASESPLSDRRVPWSLRQSKPHTLSLLWLTSGEAQLRADVRCSTDCSLSPVNLAITARNPERVTPAEL